MIPEKTSITCNRYLLQCSLIVLVFICSFTRKEVPLSEINHEVLIQHLRYPWEILWGPDNHIWMTEKGGTISRINPASKQKTLVLKIPDVVSRGEGGLLGMVLHPEFMKQPYVYVAYNYNSGYGYREKIVRYTFNGSTLHSPFSLLTDINAAGIHNGCRLLISRDKKLFISTGDAANSGTSQNTGTLNGKILRINLDGSIPSDNPIPGSIIWSYGHRNPQGLVFVNEKLFSSEHGPESDDEVNIIEKGRNYGWPRVKGICDGEEKRYCKENNIKEPIKIWTPTVAVCGIDYYNENDIPEWKNSLLLTTLRESQLLQLKLNLNHTAIVETLRDICISPNGIVYVCTGNGSNDKIIEIKRK